MVNSLRAKLMVLVVMAAMVVAVTAFLAGGQVVRGTSSLQSDFEAQYPTVCAELQSCSTCHTTVPDLNPYGAALAASGNDFAAIEGDDSDGDTFTNIEEIEGCSNPADAASMPAEATETPTPEATETPTPEATETPTPEATETAVPGEFCSPVFPGTYNGTVRVDGAPATDGLVLDVLVAGTNWGSAVVTGGRYAVDVPETLPVSAPCFEGGTVTFQLSGLDCDQSETWESGLVNLDVTCQTPATPAPTPEATPPPAATPTPEATPAPTATPAAPPVTGGGGLASGSSSLPWMGLALGSGLLAMLGAHLAWSSAGRSRSR